MRCAWHSASFPFPRIGLGGKGRDSMAFLTAANDFLWGTGTLLLLLGTGIFLTLRTGFLPWRNLGWALRSALGRTARSAENANGISPFSALMTTLAATIGTGNIAGVATALVAGGPGALVWMEVAALFGLSTQYAECLLAVKFRSTNHRGEPVGGPMYVLRDGLGLRQLGNLFALFAVGASFGIGCTAQSNAIAEALSFSFGLSPLLCGIGTAIPLFFIIRGGTARISAVAAAVVPLMGLLYLAAGIAVILGHWEQIPAALSSMVQEAFSLRAAAGGTAGAAMRNAARWGVARGIFSNEAGLGSAGISAAAASTDSPVRQAYISMTGTFFDTMVICTVTGLAICCSGVLDSGADGVTLTVLAFRTVLGEWGGTVLCLSIVLFAFATLIGWEYQGERAFEYLCGTKRLALYRIAFVLTAAWGALQQMKAVFLFSDICNALMCLPNLLSLLALSGTVARETRKFQRKKL